MAKVDRERAIVRAADALDKAELDLKAGKARGSLSADAWVGSDRVRLPLTHKQIIGLLRKSVREKKALLEQARGSVS